MAEDLTAPGNSEEGRRQGRCCREYQGPWEMGEGSPVCVEPAAPRNCRPGLA